MRSVFYYFVPMEIKNYEKHIFFRNVLIQQNVLLANISSETYFNEILFDSKHVPTLSFSDSTNSVILLSYKTKFRLNKYVFKQNNLQLICTFLTNNIFSLIFFR